MVAIAEARDGRVTQVGVGDSDAEGGREVRTAAAARTSNGSLVGRSLVADPDLVQTKSSVS